MTWSLSGGSAARPAADTRSRLVRHRVFYNNVEIAASSSWPCDDTRMHGLFYNISLVPSAHLTFDFQYVDPSLPGDEAVVLGGRLSLRF